eukprot:2338939-Pyramimonas_sp.AAC.1
MAAAASSADAMVDTAISQVMDRVIPGIKEQIQEHYNGTASQIKAAAEGICSTLLANGLAYEQVVAVSQNMGVHPKNRFSTGVSIQKVHALITRIMEQGWVKTELRSPRAFEKAPGEVGHEQWLFNKRLVDASDGYLAPIESHHCRFLSVSCSHTFQGVRCLVNGVKTDCSELAISNRISLEKVLSKCPSYNMPISEGCKVLVVKWEVDRRCPDLADFLQRAGNSGNGSEQLQDQLQTLLEVYLTMKRFIELKVMGRGECQMRSGFASWGGRGLGPREIGNDQRPPTQGLECRICQSLPPWKGDPQIPTVVRMIEDEKPHLKDQVESMAKFVRKFSGGPDGSFLHDLV